MKTWTNPEVEELEVKLTAHGTHDWIIELSHNGCGTNNDLCDGEDSDGDGISGTICGGCGGNHDGTGNNGDNPIPDEEGTPS